MDLESQEINEQETLRAQARQRPRRTAVRARLRGRRAARSRWREAIAFPAADSEWPPFRETERKHTGPASTGRSPPLLPVTRGVWVN